jgi:hypothetical protein
MAVRSAKEVVGIGGRLERRLEAIGSQDGLTFKVARVRDDDSAGRFQLVQRGRHFERWDLEISGWWWSGVRKGVSG